MRPFGLALLGMLVVSAVCRAQDEQFLVRCETPPPHAMWLESLNLDLMDAGWGIPRAARSVWGGPIRVAGMAFPHGVGTHAVSRLEIDLKGAARRFLSMVGVDESMGREGCVDFVVERDGQTVYQSGVLRGGQFRFVSVDLTGARRLVLKVGDGGDGIGRDHADWAGALLLLKPDTAELPVAQAPWTGERVAVPLPAKPPGWYELSVSVPRGPDYAKVQFWLDGRALGAPVDLFSDPPSKAMRLQLGTVEVKAGGSALSAEIIGHRRGAADYRVRIEGVALVPPRRDVPSRLAWVKHVGACDLGQMVALADGGALVTGAFWGTTVFGKGEADETKLTAYGQRDIFLARYRADGTLAWVRQAGGVEDDMGNALAATADGGAVITGKVVGRAVFGEGEAGEVTAWPIGRFDAFVARYGPEGRLLWCRRIGHDGFNQGQAVVVGQDGAIWAAGSFWGQCIVGLGEQRETRLQANGGSNYFVAQFGADGALRHATSVQSQDFVVLARLGTLPDGGVLLSGPFVNAAVCGTDTATAQRVVGRPGARTDTFVARIGADGRCQAIRSLGSLQPTSHNGLATVPGDGLLLTGRYDWEQHVLSPDEPILSRVPTPRNGHFIAKCRPDGTLAWTGLVGGDGILVWGRGAALPGGGGVVTGRFRGVAMFGPGEASGLALAGRTTEPVKPAASAPVAGDMFCVFYRDDGSVLGAWRVGGQPCITGEAVAPLADGALLVGGSFVGQSSFQPDDEESPLLAADSEIGDLFLARYESAL